MRLLALICLAVGLGTATIAQEALILTGPESALSVPVEDIDVLESEDDAVWVRLADEWIQPFGEFTAQNVTLQVEVALCDTVLSAPRINAPIYSPQFPLTDDAEVAAWVRAVLSGSVTCAERP